MRWGGVPLSSISFWQRPLPSHTNYTTRHVNTASCSKWLIFKAKIWFRPAVSKPRKCLIIDGDAGIFDHQAKEKCLNFRLVQLHPSVISSENTRFQYLELLISFKTILRQYLDGMIFQTLKKWTSCFVQVQNLFEERRKKWQRSSVKLQI